MRSDIYYRENIMIRGHKISIRRLKYAVVVFIDILVKYNLATQIIFLSKKLTNNTLGLVDEGCFDFFFLGH